MNEDSPAEALHGNGHDTAAEWAAAWNRASRDARITLAPDQLQKLRHRIAADQALQRLHRRRRLWLIAIAIVTVPGIMLLTRLGWLVARLAISSLD